MALPSVNVVTNKVSTPQRFIQLERTLHNTFFQHEFVHQVDLATLVTQLNAKIAEIELTYNTILQTQAGQIQALNAYIASHTHEATLKASVDGSNSAGPVHSEGAASGVTFQPVTPPPTLVTAGNGSYTSKTPLVPTKVALQTTNTALMALGPAIAPLGDGFSTEAIAATITARADVGVV